MPPFGTKVGFSVKAAMIECTIKYSESGFYTELNNMMRFVDLNSAQSVSQ